jgi:hypothetical protein
MYVSDFRQSRWFVWLIPEWYNQRILSVIERKAKCRCSQKAPNALKTVWNFRLLVCGVLLTSPFSFFHYVNQWWTSYHASMSLSKFMSMSVSISVSMSVSMSGPVSLSVFCVHVRASVRPCPCSISAHVLVHVACIYVCKMQEPTHLRPPPPPPHFYGKLTMHSRRGQTDSSVGTAKLFNVFGDFLATTMRRLSFYNV